MEPGLRAQFNADFTPEKYAALLRCVNGATKWPADFRISETPIFLTREFTDEAVYAANQIALQTQTPEFAMHAASAIPPGLEVPNESKHPEFLIVDLAVCEEGHRLTPRLIELQAFPSLFGFQFYCLVACGKRFRRFHEAGHRLSVASKTSNTSISCGERFSLIQNPRT